MAVPLDWRAIERHSRGHSGCSIRLQMLQRIFHYRLLEPLGSGGEGQVWRAEDLRLKRVVAIKFLNPEHAGGEQATERVRSEAQMAAALNQPNIAAIYELGEAGDLIYIVMECIEGKDLKSILERGPLDLTAAIDIALQIIEALTAAHTSGLIHCDIKSSNIMVNSRGLVKVLDFGLARARSTTVCETHDAVPAGNSIGAPKAQNDLESPALAKEIFGTPGYMSPEQLRGDALDERTDMFSLGAVLYEMLTARLPFDRETRTDVFHATLNEEPSALSSFRDDVPLELERIVRRALAKNRTDRYESAEALRLDLSALKAQLEKPAIRERRFADDMNPERATSAIDPISSLRASLRGTAWRYRRWLLLTGVLAASIALWAILQSHGAQRTAAAAWLAIAALCAWGYAASRKSAPVPAQTSAGGMAFRGLLPFQEADRSRFYGRETETAALFELIRHGDFRFGVLFGEWVAARPHY